MADHDDYCLSEERQNDELQDEGGAGGSNVTEAEAEEEEEEEEGEGDQGVGRGTPEAAAASGSKGKGGRSRNCFLCNKTYASQFTLNRHLTTQHKIKPSPTTRVLQCPVDKCEGQFNYMGNLRDHLRKGHGINIVGGTVHRFISMEVFLTWKANEERLTHTKFVRPHGKYSRHDGAQVHQFYCHRSGNYRAEGKGLRKLKSKGSCKMGAVCPATITAYQLPGGCVDVKYFSTHVGHFTDLEELYFTNDERCRVIAMVAEGTPFNAVLDRVRDSLCGEVEGLRKFIEKDLRIIDKTFELWRRHDDDDDDGHDGAAAEADKFNKFEVMALVRELTSMGEDNPVALSVLPWTDSGLAVRKDLMVVVMNDVQCEMLRRFGNEGLVCVDVTAANEGSDKAFFDLVSVMTVDSFGQAYPCAICLTNSLDRSALTTFFETVRSKAGKIRAKQLMSGDDPVHYECWSGVMGEPEKRLLSSWKIDQVWRKNLSKIAGKPYQKATAYKALRVMVREPNDKKFELLMTAFKFHTLQSKYTEQFGKYLESEWEGRADQWAFCHRGEECARCDLELEAMHLTLTHIHPKSTARSRMDTALQAIFRFVRDKSLSRLVQCCADMCAARATAIAGRHADSLALDLGCVVAFEDNLRWIVRSRRGGEFLVERTAEECAADCALRCHACGLCVHEITCSCTDSIIRGTLCKHIHLVGRYSSEGVAKVEVMEEEKEEEEEEEQEVEPPLKRVRLVARYADEEVAKIEVMEAEEELTEDPALKRLPLLRRFVRGGVVEEIAEGEELEAELGRVLRGEVAKVNTLKEEVFGEVHEEDGEELREEEEEEDTPQHELVVVAEHVDDLSKEVLRQISAVSHAEVSVKVEELISEIDACSRQISADANNISDYEVLKHLNEEMKKLMDVSRKASLSSANSGNVICIPLQDLQSVLRGESAPRSEDLVWLAGGGLNFETL